MNGVVEGVEKPRCVRRLPRLNWGKGRLEEGVSRRNVAPKTIEELWQCQLTLPFWPISPPPHTHTAVPRRYLGRGKDAKGIDGGVGGKAEALPFRGNDRGHKSAVADRVVELVLVGPVGALVDVSEEGVVLVNSCG